MTELILDVRGLSVSFPRRQVVQDLSFSMNEGEVLAIVGESGSGKTMTARALPDLLPAGGSISAGSIQFKGQNLCDLPVSGKQSLRGPSIAMVFQDPVASLNPALKIGFQLLESAKKHTDLSEEEIRERAIDLLERVNIRNAVDCLKKFPHEFSGGMRQRIMIASAMMLKPALLIADEPTTALDCLVQKDVLDILLRLAKEEGTAVLLVSHDLALVAKYADHVLVMQNGRATEYGPVQKVLSAPSSTYTRQLLEALPKPGALNNSNNLLIDPVVTVRNLCAAYPKRKKWFWQKQEYDQVLHEVTFDLLQGETLAIVGESGSGKSTLGRALLQLVKPTSGSIVVNGRLLEKTTPPDFEASRKIIQPIFQDPSAALSPRRTIRQSLAEPIEKDGLDREALNARIDEMIKATGLRPEHADRFPHELSGGQRQRVAIARALIGRPQMIIADEPVSALDNSVQAKILKLLAALKKKLQFSLIFISHDLGVVEQIADRVIVMRHGRILEIGTCEKLFAQPAHSYTRQLLSALLELRKNSDGGYTLFERALKPFNLPESFAEIGETSNESAEPFTLNNEHTLFVSRRHRTLGCDVGQ